jgi:hypothetical protein
VRLEKGKLYELDGKPWRCVLVNDCRAKLSPAWKEQRTLSNPDGTERTFFYTPESLNVSPRSILEEWADIGRPSSDGPSTGGPP